MKTSEHIGKIAEALAKAQGKFENPVRNRKVHVATKTGGGYDFHYATLDRILEHVRPILSENGLAVIQAAETKDGRVVVTSRLAHASDEWIESELSLRPEDDDPQKCGSAITYGKRYLLTSMLGIAADEDDDGNAASGNHVEQSEERPACPKCGTNRSVIKGKEEYGGGWLCFAKKGGCGEKWHDAPATDQAQPPKTNGKAKAVAKEHGLKTGDELTPPTEKTLYQKALDEIQRAIQLRDVKYLAKVIKGVADRHKEGALSDTEDSALMVAIKLAEKTIEAAAREPQGAAA